MAFILFSNVDGVKTMCVRSKMYKHVKTCGGGQTHSDPENGVREQSFGSTHFGRSTTAKNSSEREPQPHQHASIQRSYNGFKQDIHISLRRFFHSLSLWRRYLPSCLTHSGVWRRQNKSTQYFASQLAESEKLPE